MGLGAEDPPVNPGFPEHAVPFLQRAASAPAFTTHTKTQSLPIMLTALCRHFTKFRQKGKREKKNKQASSKQIPINPAVQTVIVLPTSPAPCPGLCKAPSSSSLGAVMRGAPQLLFKAYQG